MADLDQFEKRVGKIVSLIDEKAQQALLDEPMDLSGMEGEIRNICEAAKDLAPEKREVVEEQMRSLIGALDQLTAALKTMKD